MAARRKRKKRQLHKKIGGALRKQGFEPPEVSISTDVQTKAPSVEHINSFAEDIVKKPQPEPTLFGDNGLLNQGEFGDQGKYPKPQAPQPPVPNTPATDEQPSSEEESPAQENIPEKSKDGENAAAPEPEKKQTTPKKPQPTLLDRDGLLDQGEFGDQGRYDNNWNPQQRGPVETPEQEAAAAQQEQQTPSDQDNIGDAQKKQHALPQSSATDQNVTKQPSAEGTQPGLPAGGATTTPGDTKKEKDTSPQSSQQDQKREQATQLRKQQVASRRSRKNKDKRGGGNNESIEALKKEISSLQGKLKELVPTPSWLIGPGIASIQELLPLIDTGWIAAVSAILLGIAMFIWYVTRNETIKHEIRESLLKRLIASGVLDAIPYVNWFPWTVLVQLNTVYHFYKRTKEFANDLWTKKNKLKRLTQAVNKAKRPNGLNAKRAGA
ncbi:MAG: hypothetical protein GW939_00975 [Candidatus Magasanikbacteria bacterium]|nr:hypothetical protein [Candidatus Magasanikbacteria bacterium]NCS71855.1 hypothetical protein [Candidatus Magasanikbacteria bacterium]